jgi:hypothetical protein
MNCFNIRELQGILRMRFFSDLINSHEPHLFMDKVALATRFKTNNLDSINPNMLLFYRYGLQSSADSKAEIYVSPFCSTDTVHVVRADVTLYDRIEQVKSTTGLTTLLRYV